MTDREAARREEINLERERRARLARERQAQRQRNRKRSRKGYNHFGAFDELEDSMEEAEREAPGGPPSPMPHDFDKDISSIASSDSGNESDVQMKLCACPSGTDPSNCECGAREDRRAGKLGDFVLRDLEEHPWGSSDTFTERQIKHWKYLRSERKRKLKDSYERRTEIAKMLVTQHRACEAEAEEQLRILNDRLSRGKKRPRLTPRRETTWHLYSSDVAVIIWIGADVIDDSEMYLRNPQSRSDRLGVTVEIRLGYGTYLGTDKWSVPKRAGLKGGTVELHYGNTIPDDGAETDSEAELEPQENLEAGTHKVRITIIDDKYIKLKIPSRLVLHRQDLYSSKKESRLTKSNAPEFYEFTGIYVEHGPEKQREENRERSRRAALEREQEQEQSLRPFM